MLKAVSIDSSGDLDNSVPLKRSALSKAGVYSPVSVGRASEYSNVCSVIMHTSAYHAYFTTRIVYFQIRSKSRYPRGNIRPKWGLYD